MAPEVYNREELTSTASDMWSVGCVFYEVYAEEAIWQKNMLRQFQKKDLENREGQAFALSWVHETKQVPSAITAIPSPLIKVVRQCFAYKSADRPTAKQLFDVFEKQFMAKNL